MSTSGRRVAAVLALALAAALLVAGAGGAAPGPDKTAAGVASDRGSWRVDALGGDRYAVAWTSSSALPMTSDRPRIVGPGGADVGLTTVRGRTVRATVGMTSRPAADQLDVVLSGRALDEPDAVGAAARRTALRAEPLDLPGLRTLEADPGVTGPYAVTSSDYELAPVAVPGMRTPIEMVGHVVEPAADAATGPRPLVLLMHGRHDVCYQPGAPNAWTERWPCPAPFQEIPSHLGYDYLQRVLASQGYTTVSVRVNGINAQDGRSPDGGAGARAMLVAAHLDHWATIAAARQVDLRRVVLVGHSRGGEGVARAAIRIPLSAPYRIVGEVLVAPTDFGSQGTPYVPAVTLLPFCDGDVSDLQGQRFVDAGRDLSASDTALKSSVLVMGANHNYFNTVWTPDATEAPAVDDWYGPPRQECGSADPTRLTAAEQRAVGTAYVAGAVRLFASGDQQMLPLFDGSRARVASQGRAQVLSHALGGGRSVRTPAGSAARALPDGARTRLCRGSTRADRVSACAFRGRPVAAAPHWGVAGDPAPTRDFLEMTWTAVGQSGGLLLAQPLDLTGRRLEVRTLVAPSASAALDVRITDADGRSAVLSPVGGGVLPALGRSAAVSKLWAQALVVDPAGAAVDLARVARVDLVARTGSGRVWVADVSSAPAALPAVPERRLPTVDIGRLRVLEGDHGQRVTRLPFTVTGTVTEPAQVVFLTVGQAPGDVQRFAVDLAPGETGGWVPVRHEADRRPDIRRLVTQVAAFSTRNVVTDRWIGEVAVVDDDPRPRIRIRAPRRVTEGDAVRWTVSLDRVADYDVPVAIFVQRSPRPALRVEDVPSRWVEVHAGAAEPGQPLWQAGAAMFGAVRAGARRLELTLPTLRDRLAEGDESLRVRLEVGRRVLKRTITVSDAG